MVPRNDLMDPWNPRMVPQVRWTIAYSCIDQGNLNATLLTQHCSSKRFLIRVT